MSDKLYFDEQNIQTATRKLNIMGYNKVRVLIHPDLASYVPEGMNCVLCDELPRRTVRISGGARTAPWWTREWDKDGFRSYLNWCAQLYLRIRDTLYQADFSDTKFDALFDSLQEQIGPALRTLYSFTPGLLVDYDWDEVLLNFRQLLGKEQDIRTIDELFHQQDDDAVFGSMSCFYLSFLIVSKDLNEAQSLFERWANDFCLRLPISIEVLRRQAPGDTNHFPKSALDWNNEMCRDLIRRLESSSDSKFAEMNALAASLLGDERAEDRYFGKLYDLTRFRPPNSSLRSLDQESAFDEGIAVGWDEVKRKGRDDPGTSFLKVMNDSIVIRTLRKRAKQRWDTAQKKGINENKEQPKYVNEQMRKNTLKKQEAIPNPNIWINYPKSNRIKSRVQEIYTHIEATYPNKNSVESYKSIVYECVSAISEFGNLPNNEELARMSGKGLRTIVRFWGENDKHGWLDRKAFKK